MLESDHVHHWLSDIDHWYNQKEQGSKIHLLQSKHQTCLHHFEKCNCYTNRQHLLNHNRLFEKQYRYSHPKRPALRHVLLYLISLRNWYAANFAPKKEIALSTNSCLRKATISGHPSKPPMPIHRWSYHNIRQNWFHLLFQ